MKVRCIKVLSPNGVSQQSSRWLTVGKEYDVLTVEIGRDSQRYLRLVGDNKVEVALFPIECFEITSHRLAPSWIATWTNDGLFLLAPAAWLDSQFWEKFYDRDPDAVRIFEAEMATIAATL